MKIRYDGPLKSVPVAGFGVHLNGEVKEYPGEFGAELLATSKRQKFVEILEATPKEKKPRTKKIKKGGAGDGLPE